MDKYLSKSVKKVFLIILSLLLVFQLPVLGLAIMGNKVKNIDKDELQEIEEKLIEFQVPTNKRKLLLEKLKNGQMWDSFNPIYYNLEPQIIEKNYTKTIYPDGSISIKGIIPDLTDYTSIYKSGLSSKDKAKIEINERLRAGNVSTEDRSLLIEKFDKGELWDSFNPKYSNIKPTIKTPTYTKTVYPDGSFSESRIIPDLSKENSDTVLKDKSVKRGSAYQEYVLVGLYFEVTYRQSSQTNEATILSAENFSYRGIGEVITQVPGGSGYLYGWRNPTYAWYPINADAYDGTSSRKFFIKFYVNGTQTWQNSN